jgi:hypothetical protein
MAAMSALGLFSEPEYISIGDPYTSDRTKGQKLSRYSGKQFSGAPPKKGQTAGDVYFSAFQRLYEGEKYTNPGAADRAADAAKAKAKIAGDWCPNNPPKRNCGRGSYYGTIGDKFTHMGSGAASRSSREKVTTSALPNIRTNPAKLGGFGVPNTTIGNSPKYESEPYDMARKQEREASAVANHKRIGTAFKAMSHGNKDFTSSVSGSYEYKDGGLAPDDPFHKIKTEKFATAFKPSSPAKSHRQMDTLTPFPEYKPDPIAEKVAVARQELADKKAKMGPTFKPTSGPKSSRTRPINHAVH